MAIVRAFLPCADLIAPSFRESQNMANAESELQARMAAAQREMAALQQIQADLKRQDKEFQTRMDGLRGKLEASSKALSAAEQKKQRLIKEAARIQKEMQEADAEIAKQTHLKSEITKSIVNMQELQATKKREQVDESLRAAPAPPTTTPASASSGGWGASLTSWMGSAPSSVSNCSQQPYAAPRAATNSGAASAPNDLLGAPLQPAAAAATQSVGTRDLLGGFDGFEATPAPVAAPVDLLGGDMASMSMSGMGMGGGIDRHGQHGMMGVGTGMGNPFGQSQTAPQPRPPPPPSDAPDEAFGGFDTPPVGMAPLGNPQHSSQADPFAGLF